jgi:hypothetical protein
MNQTPTAIRIRILANEEMNQTPTAIRIRILANEEML